MSNDNGSKADGKIGCFLWVLCFFFPIVGLVLYLAWKRDYPLKATSSGNAALIGFIVWVVISFVL